MCWGCSSSAPPSSVIFQETKCIHMYVTQCHFFFINSAEYQDTAIIMKFLEAGAVSNPWTCCCCLFSQLRDSQSHSMHVHSAVQMCYSQVRAHRMALFFMINGVTAWHSFCARTSMHSSFRVPFESISPPTAAIQPSEKHLWRVEWCSREAGDISWRFSERKRKPTTLRGVALYLVCHWMSVRW